MTWRSLLLSFTLLFAFLPANPQEPATEPDPQFTAQRGNPNTWEQDQIRKMQRAQKEERQKKLKEDTERLLSLATELKESVDKTNQNVLSLEVVKKAEEIEKLAKKIKTNMRDEIR